MKKKMRHYPLPNIPNLAQAKFWAQDLLSKSGVENADREWHWLLDPILSASDSTISSALSSSLIHGARPLTERQWSRYKMNVTSRSRRYPLAYILGNQEFYDLEFTVNPSVLIPRPETSLLVDMALKGLSKIKLNVSLLDIGTGSGNIAIAIAKNKPNSKLTAVDISSAALKVAKFNAINHNVQDQIRFLKSNLLQSVTGKYVMIVSNPPYIPSETLAHLEPELKYEPKRALTGGLTGFRVIQRIIKQAKSHLIPGGFIALEIGYDQSRSVRNYLKHSGYQNIQLFRDQAGNFRAIQAQFNG